MAEVLSTIYTATAPKLAGVWLHDPRDPEDTITQFPYGNVGRTEGLSIESKALTYVGRALPVYDMGGFESQELGIDILIPSGDDEQALVAWFRAAVRSRAVLAYRDNRGRLAYGIINNIGFTDAREGTAVRFTFNTADYNEAI